MTEINISEISKQRRLVISTHLPLSSLSSAIVKMFLQLAIKFGIHFEIPWQMV